mmetsp:Transcript_27813/g.91010  ORF Transcript_27813/g.91010 Transcript_27813/m.91010 type:complete len:232 (-) Transcript_27813:6-701(-)
MAVWSPVSSRSRTADSPEASRSAIFCSIKSSNFISMRCGLHRTSSNSISFSSVSRRYWSMPSASVSGADSQRCARNSMSSALCFSYSSCCRCFSSCSASSALCLIRRSIKLLLPSSTSPSTLSGSHCSSSTSSSCIVLPSALMSTPVLSSDTIFPISLPSAPMRSTLRLTFCKISSGLKEEKRTALSPRRAGSAPPDRRATRPPSRLPVTRLETRAALCRCEKVAISASLW